MKSPEQPEQRFSFGITPDGRVNFGVRPTGHDGWFYLQFRASDARRIAMHLAKLADQAEGGMPEVYQ